ncbi:MAG: CoB--CoM heterodisulfide reductase subunit C [Candidatus Methanoperedenaceae archaeon]|nr:CoB--CoM heterodisulfide reductase subunit C [Candidatus Methanoperedenaceae archaeon]MDW7726246.1 CoB--CoM heterodisulfide reductase subunit C [Candidatus Methanoperedens sp.]
MSLPIIQSMKNSEILTCFQCGTCHASCPSGKYTSLNVRRIVRDSARKDISDEPSLWMCTTCYNCQERCPRGIKVTDCVLALRSEAVKKGIILPAHRKVCESLIKTGHAIPPDEKHESIREIIGLGLPETVRKYPKALEEVKTLLSSTKFIGLIIE